MTRSAPEQTFDFYAKVAKLPPYEIEYEFHSTRKWRFDTAFPSGNAGIAVEIDGGNHMAKWSKKLNKCVPVGRHTKDEDYEKRNAAICMGWKILSFTPGMLKKDPLGCMKQVQDLLDQREGTT